MPTRPAVEPDPFAAILRGIAEARVADAATARARTNWLGRQAEEMATLADALVDLAEQRAWVQLRLRGGAGVLGAITGLGADVAALATEAGPALVRIDRVTRVRTTGATVPSAAGPHAATDGPTFAGMLRDLAPERPWVLVRTDDGEELRGRLRAVGADVLTLRIGTSPVATVLVSLDAVTMVGLVAAP